MRDLPHSLDLLALGRELLLDELVPLLPAERRRDARLIATVMAIVAREAAREGWREEIGESLSRFYQAREVSLSALQGGEGGDPARSDGEGEVGSGERSGIPHLTPALSAPEGGEEVSRGNGKAVSEPAPTPTLPRRRGREQSDASSFATPSPAGGGGSGWGLEGQRSEPLSRLAADLRNGAFETSPSRAAAARAILWSLTIEKLREGNPHFLAANGLAAADDEGA